MPGQPENTLWGAITTTVLAIAGRLNPTGTRDKSTEPKPVKPQKARKGGTRGH